MGRELEGVDDEEGAYQVGTKFHVIGRLRTNRNVGNYFPRSRRVHRNGTIPVGREGKDWMGSRLTSARMSANVMGNWEPITAWEIISRGHDGPTKAGRSSRVERDGGGHYGEGVTSQSQCGR